MGASAWDYVTGYDGDAGAAVAALQARVFQEEYGDDPHYRTLAELHEDEEFMGTQGTHTILDIDTVVAPDAPPARSFADEFGTLHLLPLDRVAHHFGTDRPSVAQFEKLMATADEAPSGDEDAESLFDECLLPWTGYYVVLYSDDRPTDLGIFGSSGD